MIQVRHEVSDYRIIYLLQQQRQLNTMAANEATYWASKGRYQELYDSLSAEIPSEGECPPSRPKLEALRVAGNAYHDLFNNGGGNRYNDIQAVAGCVPDDLDELVDEEDLFAHSVRDFEQPKLKFRPFDEVAASMETEVDRIILEAAEESTEAKKAAVAATEYERMAVLDILHVARARLENGAELHEAFDWAEEEFANLMRGEFDRHDDVLSVMEFSDKMGGVF